MKPQLITFLVVLCLAFYCHSLKVKLYTNLQEITLPSGLGPYKTLYVNCDWTLDQKETLASLSMTKDDKQFFSYKQLPNFDLSFTPIPGINKLIFGDIGKVEIPNVNKTTYGMYKCTARSGNGKLVTDQHVVSGEQSTQGGGQVSIRIQTKEDHHYGGGAPAMALSLPLLAIALITFSVIY